MTLPLKTVRLYLDVEVKQGKSLGPQASTLLVALTRMLISSHRFNDLNTERRNSQYIMRCEKIIAL